MSKAMIPPKFYAWDRNGKPLAFGKVYTYQSRTNAEKPTYKSEDSKVENTNPVILSGEGYADIYLSGSYKIVVKDSNDNEIWSADPVTESESDALSYMVTAYYISSTSFKALGNHTGAIIKGGRVKFGFVGLSDKETTVLSSAYDGEFTVVLVEDALIRTDVTTASISTGFGAISNFQVESKEQLEKQEDEFQSRFSLTQPAIEWQSELIVEDNLQLYSTGLVGESGYSVWLPDPNKTPFTASSTFAEDQALDRWKLAIVSTNDWTEEKIEESKKESGLEAAALAAGTTYDNITYSTNLVDGIKGYMFDADGQVTYAVPEAAQGKFIQSVVDGVLTTTDASEYSLAGYSKGLVAVVSMSCDTVSDLFNISLSEQDYGKYVETKQFHDTCKLGGQKYLVLSGAEALERDLSSKPYYTESKLNIHGMAAFKISDDFYLLHREIALENFNIEVTTFGAIPDAVVDDDRYLTLNGNPTDNNLPFKNACDCTIYNYVGRNRYLYNRANITLAYHPRGYSFSGGIRIAENAKYDLSLNRIFAIDNPDFIFELNTRMIRDSGDDAGYYYRGHVQGFTFRNARIGSVREYTREDAADFNHLLKLNGGWMLRCGIYDIYSDPGAAYKSIIDWDLSHPDSGVYEVGVPDQIDMKNISAMYSENSSYVISLTGDTDGTGSRVGTVYFTNIHAGNTYGQSFVDRSVGVDDDTGVIRVFNTLIGPSEFDFIFGAEHLLNVPMTADQSISGCRGSRFIHLDVEKNRDKGVGRGPMLNGGLYRQCDFGLMKPQSEMDKLTRDPQMVDITAQSCTWTRIQLNDKGHGGFALPKDYFNLRQGSKDNEINTPLVSSTVNTVNRAWEMSMFTVPYDTKFTNLTSPLVSSAFAQDNIKIGFKCIVSAEALSLYSIDIAGEDGVYYSFSYTSGASATEQEIVDGLISNFNSNASSTLKSDVELLNASNSLSIQSIRGKSDEVSIDNNSSNITTTELHIIKLATYSGETLDVSSMIKSRLGAGSDASSSFSMDIRINYELSTVKDDLIRTIDNIGDSGEDSEAVININPVYRTPYYQDYNNIYYISTSVHGSSAGTSFIRKIMEVEPTSPFTLYVKFTSAVGNVFFSGSETSMRYSTSYVNFF